MAYSYKGNISFGLVYIPITLHSCVKSKDLGFNMIDKKTMSRIKYVKTCVDCDGREVNNDDIAKGFEYEKGKYVIFEPSDFEKIKSQKDKNISIEQFVNIDDINPLHFDKAYYVNPTGAENAFAVLLAAMEKGKRAAIATTVLGTKQTLVAIRAEKGQMLLNTLLFESDLAKNPAKIPTQPPKANELKIAQAIIDGMTGKLDISKYKDEYRQKVFDAIEQKVNGKQIVAHRQGRIDKTANLLEALNASLAEMKTKKANKPTISITKNTQQKSTKKA